MSGRTWLTRVALRSYPPSFQARYGEELAALVEDLPAPHRGTANLLMHAALAWIRPSFNGGDGRRHRLQASVVTTWMAWCAGILIAPLVNRALLDPPMAGATNGVRTLLQAGYVLFIVGWAVALLGAAPLLLRVVLPALRARAWATLRPLVPTFTLGVAESAGLIAIALTHGGGGNPSVSLRIGAGIWVVGFLAFVISLGVGPAVTLQRINADRSVLRFPVLVTAPLAVALAAITACSLVATVQAGDAEIGGSTAPVYVALAVATLASLIALVSSARGVRAAVAG